MRRIEFTIHTQNDGSGKKRWRASRLFRIFPLACLLLTTLWGPSLHAQCALVCNDDENVSMPGTDANCSVEITVDMVLEDPASCQNGILVVESDGHSGAAIALQSVPECIAYRYDGDLLCNGFEQWELLLGDPYN